MDDTRADKAADATMIAGLPTTGGVHCETTTLGVLLAHAGVPLSEPMLFGLGSGLSFIYWDPRRMPMPFLGGRVKPFLLTQNLCTRLGLRLTVQETTSPRKAWDQVRSAVDGGVPVGLQLDSHDLEYFGSRVHFAGHVVALRGYDRTTAYLVDTAQQGGAVSTSLESLARARAARGPLSARQRSFTIEAPAAVDPAAAIIPSITACADAFLHPPIANLGGRGILTAARRVRSWGERAQDPARDLPEVAMLMERAGTGGALFRTLYRDFLTECVGLLEDAAAASAVAEARELFAASARRWTSTAEHIERAGRSGDPDHLDEASRELEHIAALESDAMTMLLGLERTR